ncbi:MAG: hypothetical protein KF789_00065 [Bdellovibrionaceae bacterium]|nr:hypothetical protein [Pseudobdellovibrionaceae bacterium]
MAEKKLHRFEQGWMALAVKEQLERKGIEARVVSQPREYTTLVLGGVQDRADLYISERDFISAKHVLDEFLADGEGAETSADDLPARKNYRKRVVIFSLLGFLLPLVFNFVATLNFVEMKRRDPPSKWDLWVLLVLMLGWTVALIIVVDGFFLRLL